MESEITPLVSGLLSRELGEADSWHQLALYRLELAETRAAVEINLREAAARDGVKLTEGAVAAHVTIDPAVRDAERKVLSAEHALRTTRARVEGEQWTLKLALAKLMQSVTPR